MLETTEKTHAATAAAEALRILLVDDNRTFVAAVRQVLDTMPGTDIVGQAHDGATALTKAVQLQPDLMLLDMAMPDMSGLDVARHMRSWPRRPGIVFLSMHDNAAYRAAAYTLGAMGFVGKADFVGELLPIVERLIADKSTS